jgi:ribosomal protein S18 acetylase RimI-like enzyme
VAADALSRCGSDVLRVRQWRSRSDVAHLTPLTTPGGLTRAHVQDTSDVLRSVGVTSIVTSAIGPTEATVFNSAGFSVREELSLLSHDLTDLPQQAEPEPGDRLRRPTRSEFDDVLTVDSAAFQGFWRFDDTGLRDAIAATPYTRVGAAECFDRAPSIVGYAVTGRAGKTGFVQRLAVKPDHAGRGLGALLVVDGLYWLQRRRCTQAFVNTQSVNHRALALYDRLGFVPEPHGLWVLQIGPDDGPLGLVP